MPTEWTEGRWGDIATLEYGRALRGYKHKAGRFRVYGTNGPIGSHDDPLCTHPTVIIGRKGAYRGVHYSPDPCYVIDTAFYLKPTADIDIRWAYYQLLTQDINRMNSGSAIPSTSRAEFYELPVRIPSLGVQQAIAQIIGTIDDRIRLSWQTSCTLEALTSTVFRPWFIDFDPVKVMQEDRNSLYPEYVTDLFSGGLVDSELGPIPEGWSIKSLDEIATFVNGLALKKYPPTGDAALPIIKIAQLRSGKLQGADLASAELDTKYVVYDGDILFSWSGSLECRFWTGGSGALNQHLFKVIPNAYPKWLCYFGILKHLAEFREIAAEKATTMGHIQRHHLSDAKQAVPPHDLLASLDRIIGPLVERMVAAAIEARGLETIRDALLPQLVDGRLEIPINTSS